MKYELLKFPHVIGQPDKGFYTVPNYFNIKNGTGFQSDGDDESFSITGYIPERQAKLLANADKLLTALKAAHTILIEANEKWSNGDDSYQSALELCESAIKDATI